MFDLNGRCQLITKIEISCKKTKENCYESEVIQNYEHSETWGYSRIVTKSINIFYEDRLT
jgi:hypothetical protein